MKEINVIEIDKIDHKIIITSLEEIILCLITFIQYKKINYKLLL